MKTRKKDTQKSSPKAAENEGKSTGFSDEERAAMKERAQELRAAAPRSGAGNVDGESDVLAKIAEMQEPDRTMAQRVHALIKASAPVLAPRTWYGMPAYEKEGKVVCFFQRAEVQGEVLYAGLQRRGKARPRRHLANRLRVE